MKKRINVRTTNSGADGMVSWWYWFEKLDGNIAKCKHCEWTKNRGQGQSMAWECGTILIFNLEGTNNCVITYIMHAKIICNERSGR